MTAVLLLGGRSAIGLAVVEELLRREPGRRVLLASRGGGGGDHASEARSACQRLLEAGAADVVELDFDALDLAGHEAWLEGVCDEHDVETAVLAFGVLGDQEQAWRDVAAAQRMLQVNATAPVGLGVVLARRMRRRGGGRIVAISSVAGTRVRRSNFVYGASKAAMDAFFLNLATALDGTGVRVLVVRPGAVRSPMIEGNDPVAFTVEPGQVARAAVDALEAGRELVHVPGGFGPAMVLAHLVPQRLWRKVST